MNQPSIRTRRDVLRDFLATATVAGGMSMAGGCNFGNQPGLGAESEQAKKAGQKPVWPIACRDSHLREMGQPDSWSAMSVIGADGMEVSVEYDLNCPYVFEGPEKFSIASPAQIKTLAGRLKEHRKKITAFCLHNDFDTRQDQEVAFTVKVAEVAAELGVPAIVGVADAATALKEGQLVTLDPAHGCIYEGEVQV